MIVRSFGVILVIMAHAFFTAGVSAQTCCCYAWIESYTTCEMESLMCGPCSPQNPCEGEGDVIAWTQNVVAVGIGAYNASYQVSCLVRYKCGGGDPPCLNGVCTYDLSDPVQMSVQQITINELVGTCIGS